MRRTLLPVVLLCAADVVGCGGCAPQPPLRASDAPLLTAAALTTQSVVGMLGLPLGTVTEIRATIVAGSELRMKEFEGRYLLRVTEVTGRPLPQPRIMEFFVPSIAQVSDPLIKPGPAAVGKQLHLTAYETGAYSGIPSNLPKNIPIWQDHAFAFSTSLVVLAER